MKIYLYYIIIIFLFLYPSKGYSQGSDMGDASPVSKSLLTHVDYLVDEDGSFRIEDVSSGFFFRKFIQLESEKINFGFSNAVYWLRFEVDFYEHPYELVLEIDQPLIDQIDLYYKSENGKWLSRRSGLKVGFAQRDLPHKNITFLLKNSGAGHGVYYLRVQNKGSLQIPIYLMELNNFYRNAMNHLLSFGVLFGIFILTLLYGLILGVQFGNTSYLYFAVYTASLLLVMITLNGFGFEYFWPNRTDWAQHSGYISINFTVLFSMLFFRTFLNTKKVASGFNKFLLAFALVSIVIPFSGWLIDRTLAEELTILNGVFSSILCFLAVLISRARGVEETRFAVTGMYFFVVGIFLDSMRLYNIVERSFFAEFGFEIGSTTLVVFLAVALNDKYAISLKSKQNLINSNVSVPSGVSEEGQSSQAKINTENQS